MPQRYEQNERFTMLAKLLQVEIIKNTASNNYAIDILDKNVLSFKNLRLKNKKEKIEFSSELHNIITKELKKYTTLRLF